MKEPPIPALFSETEQLRVVRTQRDRLHRMLQKTGEWIDNNVAYGSPELQEEIERTLKESKP